MLNEFSHVPPPNPDYLWEFSAEEEKILMVDRNREPVMRCKLEALADGAEVCIWHAVFGSHRAFLEMGVPKIVLSAKTGRLIESPDSDCPLITLTLRRIESNRAYIQVTAHPGFKQWVRKEPVVQ
jgi:hypothetical protein